MYSIPGSFLILLFLVLTGCSGREVRPEPEAVLSLTIVAGSDSNNGAGMNSSLQFDAAPLQLRMYELQSTGLFANADFLDIYLQDSAILQGTLVKKHRLPTVWPDTQSQLTLPLDRATRFIAIFAEFASYQSSIWSVLESIVPGSQNSMTLQINGNHLRLSVGSLLAADNHAGQSHGSQL